MMMPSLRWPRGPFGLAQTPATCDQRRACLITASGELTRGDTIQVTVKEPSPGMTRTLNGSSLWSVGPLVSVTVIVIELIVMLL